MAAESIKCTKCGTQIEPGIKYIETNFGDVFLEDCFVCEKSGIKLEGSYVCLNDSGEPRRDKHEKGNYFHPDHAPSKAKSIKCTKCGTQIGPGIKYIETNFGDIFLQDCFVCEKSGIKLDGPYVCLNDAGEPRRDKHEKGHYFHPDHAPGKAKSIKCTKCGTQIEPGTKYIETNFGDVFLEDCFVCDQSGVKLDGPYVCLNDAGEPRRFKYEKGHYFHPEHAPGKATVSGTSPAKGDVCYICETPLDGEECIQLLDGKKVKMGCLKKAGIDLSDKNSFRLLRNQVEQIKKGRPLFTGPTEDGEKEKAALEEAFAKRMEEAEKVGEERRKKDEEVAAAKAAREKHFLEVQEQKRKDFEAAKAKDQADKEQAEADKKNRLDANGKWTIAELKDAQLRKDYCVAELTAGQPETLLSDADFQTAFGMDRETFEKLAGWKQKDARKRQGIF